MFIEKYIICDIKLVLFKCTMKYVFKVYSFGIAVLIYISTNLVKVREV